MKFAISREELLKPLQHVSGVVEKRQLMPVLNNLLVEVAGGKLFLTGTDLELSLVACLPVGQTAEAGEVTIPARKLVDICKSLGAETEIRVERDGERVNIRAGRSRFSLATLPVTDFPSLERAGESSLQVKVKTEDLKAVIDATAFAMAQQDVRYYLNGMLFEVRGNTFKTVATDGHRLSVAETACESTIDQVLQVIVPRKSVGELARLLADSRVEDVTVEIGGTHIKAVIGDITFTSKLVDGKFPEYERVIPRECPRVVIADRELLRQALVRVAILSNEKYRGVRLQVSEGSLRLQANNPEQEEAEEEVLVDYEGTELEIGFNVSYLVDALNAINGPVVEFQLGDAGGSAILVDPENRQTIYVVMPMRL